MPSKKSKVNLYADENIPVQVVSHLKSRGISIVHCFDYHYVNKKDELHFKKSKSLKKILLSLDKDFRKYKDFPIKNHPGIILITAGNTTYDHLNKILDKVLRFISEDIVKHAILRATIDKIVKEKDGKITERNIS